MGEEIPARRTWNHAQKVARLTELCRELVKHGIRVEMSDARPALSVRSSLTTPRVSIQMIDGAFVWRCDDTDRHEADDVSGAAHRIAAYLKARDGDDVS
ncbi:hypothetical protein NE236_34225 [Actinoallomurus purpureus]|uniref:hypothetical protein n=1 Tax=Actinoallomurus purpureus TaxID=478114 RepID=UPI002093A4E2|nr:hypothetical protein [Actinoallomurus purpureus]MCO6010040.1 hypothetical protein [Actinoallomurus purpureus]